jgi:hypothetical protein
MSNTLALTGMDAATEAALRDTFEQANQRLGGRWRLLDEHAADYIIVDLDSMYGPMSWLRLHGAGKRVIGLTAATRVQTDHHLPRPFAADNLASLLGDIDGQPLNDAPIATATIPTPAIAAATTAAPVAPPAAPSATPTATPTATPEPAVATPTPALAPLAARSGPRPLAAWLQHGLPAGRRSLQRAEAPQLLVDASARLYHGPATLKSLATYFEDDLDPADFTEIAEDAWLKASVALGAAQPLARLQWFGGLLAGGGALLPEHDQHARYRLLKWPQTEREFPRHFRIATAMMKGPATLAQLVETCGVAEAEVADYLNANLAIGLAVVEPETPPEAPEPARGGLLGRLRGR